MVKKKEKEINQLRSIDLSGKMINKLNMDFDTDSEHNLDVATSLGLLYSLERFDNSKVIEKKLLKPMTFLSLTNNVQKKNMEKLMENNVFINGSSRKQWLNIIKNFTKGLSRYEVKNESRLSRILNRQ